MNPLSVVIITQNEKENIARCLDSVSWADDVVVVDSGSADGTAEACRERGCRVIVRDIWEGFGAQKRFAVEQAAHDWVLSLDADEEVDDDLQDAVRSVLAAPDCAGYRVSRRSFYLGRKINHCGWDRDRPIRLFNRQTGTFNRRTVHEAVKLKGQVGELRGELLHHTYPTVASHYRKMDLYAGLAAERMLRRGQKAYPGQALAHGTAKFLKMYLLQTGFLDRGTGLMLSLRSSYGVYLKYKYLWQKTR